MSEIHWIKITTDMFDDEKIRLIEKMPDGDTILIIWIKLLTLTGRVNAGGYILLTENIPYTEEMLATIFDRPLMTVQLAMKTFEQFKMLHFDNDTMVISNWNKHQNVEALLKIKEQTRLRVAKHRANLLCNVTSPLQVTQGNATEADKDTEAELEEDKEGSSSLPNIFKVYESEIGMLTPMISESIKVDLDTFPEDWIIDAINVASKANHRSYRYVQGILRRWSTESRDVAPKELSVEEQALVEKESVPERAQDIQFDIARINAIFAEDEIMNEDAQYLGSIQWHAQGLASSQNLYRIYRCVTGKEAADPRLVYLWGESLFNAGIEVGKVEKQDATIKIKTH